MLTEQKGGPHNSGGGELEAWVDNICAIKCLIEISSRRPISVKLEAQKFLDSQNE